MATKKQIASNRRNAQKSTGPTSVAGKAVSSQNALKSGIDSHSEIIRGEKAKELDALKAEYYAEHAPVSTAERTLVDTLIHNEWLLRRLRRVEAELFEFVITRNREYSSYAPSTAVGQAFDDDDRTFERLQRRLNAAQRNYERALKELTALQSARIQTACEESASFRHTPSPASEAARIEPSMAVNLPDSAPAIPPSGVLDTPDHPPLNA